MAAYEKPEGTVALSKFQTKPLHGDQFTEVMPMWKLRTWDMWSKYAQAHFSHDGNESDSSANEKSNSKPEKIASFESHPTLGWPMLPKMGNKTSQECKDTMRAFVTETYRNFTRDSQAKVPWKDLSLDEQHELISKDSFPEDMRLLDPSKLQRCDVEALWQHWTRRQKANARPLIFYASAAVNIRRAKARPSRPKKARRPSPQHVSEEEDNGDNEDDDEDDNEDEADNKKSETPHPHSPAANAASPGSKIDFLRNLSSDLVYTEFVDRLSSRKEQEDGLPAENLPDWGKWQWSSMYLPVEFHQNGALLPLFRLAREEWTKMGADAELVVLSMGLALRDINAAHFNEELPEDAPDWLKVSPLDINSAHRLSEIWGKQLQPAKPAMKAKTKANTRTATGSGKRKVPPNDSESEERIPKYKKGKGVKGRRLRPSRLTLLMLAEEVEAEEVEAEEEEVQMQEAEDKQTLQQHPTSDSAETLQKYSQEIERRQTASSPNSNGTIWPISESQNSTPGSERAVDWLSQLDPAIDDIEDVWDQFLDAFAEQFQDSQKGEHTRTGLESIKMTWPLIDQ
ncbi:hypothetical protein BJV77DRAFT_1071175 [Russula vinacea]|nr:hypothetical protein BJV77DRAFT_1071175 [Russula vinacea]